MIDFSSSRVGYVHTRWLACQDCVLLPRVHYWFLLHMHIIITPKDSHSHG